MKSVKKKEQTLFDQLHERSHWKAKDEFMEHLCSWFLSVNHHVFQCVGKSQSILIQVSDRNHVQPVQAEINNKTMNNNNDYKL